MQLGGEVVSVVRHGTVAHLTVQDPIYKAHLPIRVLEEHAETEATVTIGLGDAVWWQGNDVRWTSKTLLGIAPALGCGRTWAVPLPRVGYRG
jgi:hypothetical protein